MEFRQLLPASGAVDVDALLDSLVLASRARPDRPYTVVNFIASVDGHATFGGRSGAFGDDGDRAMFNGLREHCDAVMAGTGTLRAERYGRILGNQERRQRRVERGLSPEPLACIITRSGEIPDDIPLFCEPEARVVVFSPAELPEDGWGAQVEQVRLDPGQPAITAALAALRSRYGVRALLCEGGPALFGALLRAQVVDELFLTLAPRLAGGGSGPAVTTGPELSAPASMRLLWLLERRQALYLRYAIETAPGGVGR